MVTGKWYCSVLISNCEPSILISSCPVQPRTEVTVWLWYAPASSQGQYTTNVLNKFYRWSWGEKKVKKYFPVGKMLFLSQKVVTMHVSVYGDEIFIREGEINRRTETYQNTSAKAKEFLKKNSNRKKNTLYLSKKKKSLLRDCSRESLPQEAPKFTIDFDSESKLFFWWMT